MQTADVQGVPTLTIAALAFVCLISIALLIVTGGNVALAAVPCLAIGLLYLLWRLPLRISTFAILFLSLVTERGGDSNNRFHTPLQPLGVALNSKLSLITNIKPLQFSGSDLLFFFLFVALLSRAGTGDTIDGAPKLRTATANALGIAASIFAGTVALEFVHGMGNGGDFSSALWHMRALLHIPFYFFMVQAGIRGPIDFPTMGKLLVVAACCRGALITFIHFTCPDLVHDKALGYLTNHDDSMLSSSAMSLLIIWVNETTSRRALTGFAMGMPFLLASAVFNTRRLVWVDLGMSMIVYLIISPRSRIKRELARLALIALPLFVIYVAVGWQSASGIFGPVKLVKSIVSSEADRSTMDRDVENWNLATTVPRAAITGRGLGNGYDETIAMDDISSVFPQYKSFPHDSVLGIWVLFGWLGFSGLWILFVTALYLGFRAYRQTGDPLLRVSSFASCCMVVIFLNQCYGDMAFWGDIGSILAGTAMGVISKAAVASGAWPGARGSWT